MRFQNFFVTTTLLLLTFATSSFAAQIREREAEADPRPPIRKIPDTKYFHEPGKSELLGHYDQRYYRGKPVPDDEKRETLHHLIRAYLVNFRDRNIETWIAHGTLLGWWWNGKIMPWDSDLDVQVSSSTLAWLGKNLNMTMHNYTVIAENGTEINRKYLLDINPNLVDRLRGDGQNVIDARFIDVRNGLFIDITGLSETNPSIQPGVWSCKNSHRYKTRDLYPLRETVFEGVPALVPYSFDRILSVEYTARALTKTLHQGHRWVPEQKEWVKIETTLKGNPKLNAGANPHIPRSIQADSKPRTGLRNLLRIL